MSMDLRSKINLYKTSQIKRPNLPVDSECDIQDLIDVGECHNEDGSCLCVESEYPLNYLHGGFKLGEALTVDPLSMRRISGELGEGIAVSDLLFLDTETTGLSSGTGTVAFLIGVGYFQEDFFILKQYFMRDYDQEPAVLRELNMLLSRSKGLITFNGKAFDWNLLQGRFIFNKIKPALPNPLHLDLLFPSRAIWKLKLESCRLVSLEENILGEYRVDDIPGAIIPSVYFKYLEDRNATYIKKIIKHNEQDVLSMVSLLTKICVLLDNPIDEAECQKELLGLGRIFERNREYGIVASCFEECIKSDSTIVKETASRKLSYIYKRNRDYKKAVEHWNNMIKGSKTVNLFPMIELAKYYEHKEKDIAKSIEIVERAMQCGSEIGLDNNIYCDDLKKRLSRLVRKAERRKND